MARPRSLLVSMQLTIAGRAHDCRFNSTHRIFKGERRLTIKDDGDEHHYCLACAKRFMERDTERLRVLLTSVVGEQQEGAASRDD